jgi:PAP2 superfamily
MHDLLMRLPYSGEIELMSRESAVKWLLVALVALTDWIWMASAGFLIDSGYFQAFGWIVLLILISLFYFCSGRDQRIMEFAHFGAQLLSLYALVMLLSYLAVSTDAPLVDGAFDTIDKSVGLDWVAWIEWVTAHPHLRWGLSIAYDSLPVQALLCYTYNVHTRANWRSSEIWWITFISLLVTIAGSAAFPGTNPYVYYGLEGADHFLHMKHFLGLRDGTMHVISFIDAQGLIQLPSFHTILAIMLTYNLRHNRWLFPVALLLNSALILSCPSEGSHYFIDLFAGGVVAAATIWCVRRLGRHFAWGSQPIIVINQGNRRDSHGHVLTR